MPELYTYPKQWFKVAREIISHAKKQTSLADFYQESKLKPYAQDNSFLYRKDVLDLLFQDGIIGIEGDRLRLGAIHNIDWLDKLLIDGNTDAWELAQDVKSDIDEFKKFDPETLKKIGDEGEFFVVERLKNLINVSKHKEIKHVAQTNDYAGYDIYTPSVINSDKPFKLEVKTTTRKIQNMFTFYLSRNEADIGKKFDNWCIVCLVKVNSVIEIIGHLYFYQIESRLPKDIDKRSSWSSCRVTVETDILRPGLP